MLAKDTIAVPVGESVVLRAPKLDFFQAKDFPEEGVRLTPEDDMQRTIVYTTSALLGVQAVAEPLTELHDGQQVLLYDESPTAPRRAGFRNVAPTSGKVLQGNLALPRTLVFPTSQERNDALASGELDALASPQYVWQLRQQGKEWKVYHPATQRYLPLVEDGQDVVLAAEGGLFRMTRNADQNSWKVQGTNGKFWDGKEGAMTGWHTYGHPYRFYRFVAAPFFRIVVRYVDTSGKMLFPTETLLLPGGSQVEVVSQNIQDYRWKETTATLSNLKYVDAHGEITVTYEAAAGIAGASWSTNASGSATQHLRHATYDLQGRRITPHHGAIFIVNGKKVLK